MATSIEGWSVTNWELRPQMLVVINLMNLRPPATAHSSTPHLGRLLFKRPSKVAFANSYNDPGRGWVIEEVISDNSTPSAKVFCKLKLKGGGSIEIHAQEQQLFLY